MKKLLFLVFLTPLIAVSQKLENLKAIPEGNKIIITYDLSADYSSDRFDVSLFASHNNYSSPIKLATGDVGNGISAGTNKRIEWDAKTELVDFKGQLSFEIRAEVMAVFALQGKSISAKRGKTVPLNWRGGNKKQDVKIELLKSGLVISTVNTVSNDGSYQWVVPAKQTVGKDFQIRLVNGSESAVTDSFSIKHKVPTVVKVVPAALLVLLALPQSSGTGSKDKTLPAPPDVGLN